jgi:hypothetical protein
MDRGRVGENRESKETDGCPLTAPTMDPTDFQDSPSKLEIMKTEMTKKNSQIE